MNEGSETQVEKNTITTFKNEFIIWWMGWWGCELLTSDDWKSFINYNFICVKRSIKQQCEWNISKFCANTRTLLHSSQTKQRERANYCARDLSLVNNVCDWSGIYVWWVHTRVGEYIDGHMLLSTVVTCPDDFGVKLSHVSLLTSRKYFLFL